MEGDIKKRPSSPSVFTGDALKTKGTAQPNRSAPHKRCVFGYFTETGGLAVAVGVWYNKDSKTAAGGQLMEYLEIILQDIPVSLLGSTLREQLRFHPGDVRLSHFYSEEIGETREYAEMGDWDTFFCGRGTSDMLLARLDLGMELRDAVVLISHETSPGDITIQFGEDQFRSLDGDRAEENFRKLFQRLSAICRASSPGGVLIGYEPATDRDTRIIELRGHTYRAFYENISHTPELQTLCRVGNIYFHLSEDGGRPGPQALRG